ncbi:MAG: hypothetical protein II820_05865 [Ruminiclostridium sp.]|nr:hypothetical protein [Ruminiclostridium sp.]
MNLSLKQYRNIDLLIMLVMLAAAEFLITKAATVWFPSELYVLSPTVAVMCIVMMRWGPFAAVHAAGGGLALCIASGASPEQYAVYCVGNCLGLAALLLFKTWGKEKIRNSIVYTILFTVAAFCAVQTGRWTVSLFFGAEPGSIVRLFASDSLSLAFDVITVLIARRIDGLFEDQVSYLVRTQSERNKESIPDEGDTEYNDI